MPNFNVNDAATDRTRAIHYEHHLPAPGSNRQPRPTVVLAHGWGMSTRIWDDTTAWLVDAGYPVLSFDQRNCGVSDKDFVDVSIPALADDLATLVQDLKVSAVVLNGWSLGGAVVVEAAAKLATELRGVISTCGATPRYTQADGFPHGGTAEDVAGTVMALRADRVNFLQALYSEGAFAKPVTDTVKHWAHSIALQASPAADASLGALAHIDQREALSQIQVPGLFISGSADGVVDPAIGAFAAQLCPNGQSVVLDGCGHTPFIEDPEAYRAALTSFLTSISGT